MLKEESILQWQALTRNVTIAGMNLKTIRVVICGFGMMGQVHARVYQALPGVEIVGIIDSSPVQEKVAEMGLKAAVAASITELLQSMDFDLVDICLPTDLHADMIIAAAQAGKHVFCEKPIALEVAEAERALQQVEQSGVLLQVGQCIRFWPEYQALESFMREGTGGKLVSLSLTRRAGRPGYSRDNWLLDGARSRGAALDLHIHDTDFVLHLLGKPWALHSIGRPDKNSQGWHHLFTHYLYDDVAVTAEGGWDLPPSWGFQMAFQAVFENAVIDYDSRTSPTLHLTLGDEQRAPMAFHTPEGEGVGGLGGYYNELAYFCGRIRTAKPPEIATGRQAMESLHVVLSEIESAETAQIVQLV